jgi:apolipoprotein N-acyltransferase
VVLVRLRKLAHPIAYGSREGKMRGFIWLIVAVLLLFAWVGSFIMYHVAGFLIHLLLIFGVIALVIHLFTGRRAV